MSKASPKLPDKPSELIRLALADLRKVEAMPDKYVVDMSTWHQPNGVCRVCLAGAVLAQTLQKPPSFNAVDAMGQFNELDDETESKLVALDALRTGFLDEAFENLNVDGPEDWKDADFYREITPYSPSRRERFHADMERLAADLEAKGY